MRNGFSRTQVRKIEYLAEHPELWRFSGKAVVEALVKAGLVSPKTYWKDLKPLVLVEEARLVARGKEDKR